LLPARAELIRGAVIAAAYFGAAKAGLALAFENSSITAVWPPTGIALVALVLCGKRYWPAVALGAFAANSWTGVPLVTTVGITVGNTLEALVGASLLLHVVRFRPSLERVRDVLALVACAAVFSTMVSATIGVTSLWIGGQVDAVDLPSAWRLWWLGDMGGAVIVAPLLFVFATSRRVRPPPRRVLEGVGVGLLLAVVSWLSFSQENQLEYLTFPLLAWAALRYGQLGATTGVLIVAAISVWFTARGIGPFAQGSRDDSLLLSQTFVGVASAMSLLIAAFVAERSNARAALERARVGMELKVELEKSRASLAEAQQVAHLGSWEWDVVADQLTWSDELYRIVGLDRDSLDATYDGFMQCVHPDDRDRVDSVVRKALEDCSTFEFEHRIVRPDGEVRTLYGRGDTVRGTNGEPVRMFGTGLDITDQKRLEEASTRAWNLSLDLLGIFDFEGNLKRINPAHWQILGYTEDELKGQRYFDRVHPDDRERVVAMTAELAAGEREIADLELRILRKDGAYRTLLCSAKSSPDEHLIYTVSKDITEWKRAEEAERMAAIVESSDDAIISITLDGTIRSWNPGAERLYGYSAGEMEGQSIATILTSELFGELALSMAQVKCGRSITEHHTTCVAKGGRAVDVFLSLSPIRDEDGRVIGASAIHRDISDRVQAEREKEQLQAELDATHRLESIGQLAGGVAHDFNNILAVIMNYARFVADEVPAGSRAYHDVEEIRRAANQASTLTRQLLILGHRDVTVPEVLSVNEVVSRLDNLLRSAAGEHVSLEICLGADLWAVKADPGQIEQVLMNLVVNSRDAMPDGGKVTIETANIEVGEAFARLHPDAGPGSYVRLTVRDTGSGMKDEVAKRAFEPFFTTKQKGEGTGLGLSTVYGIVTNANGIIDLDSGIGLGTTFRIYLPATAGRAPTAEPDLKRAPARANGETVLVVEDEVAVREMAERILGSTGYSVLSAGSGKEALELCSHRDRRIDVLLTDVIMPNMLGIELAKCITRARADIRVLYMSGYGHEVAQQTLLEGARFIEKPFSAEELLHSVRDVLDSSISADT
jgi:PAS domain S-box-containing protein